MEGPQDPGGSPDCSHQVAHLLHRQLPSRLGLPRQGVISLARFLRETNPTCFLGVFPSFHHLLLAGLQ